MIQVKVASKKQTKAKVSIAGPPGSGKTTTALKLAFELASSPDKILYNDTEHGSAEKYADEFPGFHTVQPSRYDIAEATETIEYAEKNGYEVVVFDSFSHYWMGQGGALESVGGNSGQWKIVTPKWERLVDKIIAAKLHVICCMRAKMAYSFEKNDRGKVEPIRLGIQPQMRDDVEYVFDIHGLLDQNNMLSIVKSRAGKHVPLNSTWPLPGKDLANGIKAFCSDGVEDRFILPVNIRDKFNELAGQMGQQAFDAAIVGAGYPSLLAIPSIEAARELYSKLQAAHKGAA